MVSKGDLAVLDTIFNPLLPTGQEEVPAENISEESDKEDTHNIPSDILDRVRSLEEKGVSEAEANNLDNAIALFSEAISLAPEWQSAYNNRAQAYRLKGDPDAAMEDLNKAIELSHGQGKSARQAFTQRALLHRLKGKDDLAKADLEAATALGSKFAKHQLVQLNPYAAMCNKMLSDVIGRLQRGEPEDQTEDSHRPA